VRRWAFDELAPAGTVLRSEMSLVGPPRSSRLTSAATRRTTSIGWARIRVSTAVARERRSDTVDFEEVIELDTQYTREWSL